MAKVKESRTEYSSEPVTIVSARGHTEIPRVLRERYSVRAKSRLRWVDTGKGLLIIPLDQHVRSKNGRRRAKVKNISAIRTENLEAIGILRDWMKEPDDWTPEQWDEFQQELRTRRLSFRKPE